jgi:hypothetical protein
MHIIGVQLGPILEGWLEKQLFPQPFIDIGYFFPYIKIRRYRYRILLYICNIVVYVEQRISLIKNFNSYLLVEEVKGHFSRVRGPAIGIGSRARAFSWGRNGLTKESVNIKNRFGLVT